MPKQLPTVTSNIPRDLRQFVERVREAINGTGDEAIVTVRQLVAAGIASYGGGKLTFDGSGNGVGEYVYPATPTGLSATGALASVIVSWDSPSYTGHAYTEIWAASRTTEQEEADPQVDPDISQAVLVGMAPGSLFSHNIGAGATRWYWIRFVNIGGEAGPYNATEGFEASTSEDPTYMLSVLSDAVTSSQLATSLLGNINTTFAQTSAPTAKADGSALVTGDLWYDTDDGNKLYRWIADVNDQLDGGTWVNTQDGGIAQAITAASTAQGTADGKVTTYYQDAAPSNLVGGVIANVLFEGDLWVDTDDGNNLYRWSADTNDEVDGGTWVDIQDAGIGTAIGDAATAQAAADGKITSYYQDDEPTATAVDGNGDLLYPYLSEGDIWVDTNDNDKVYFYDGSTWQESAIATQAYVGTQIIQQVGYCELTDDQGDKSVATAYGTKAACEAAEADPSKTQGYTFAWKDDGAIAQEVKTVTSTVGDNTTTIQAQASSIDGIEGNYTVKIDNGGHISGFGLLSTTKDDSNATSEFGVRADKFFIAPSAYANATAPTTGLYHGYVWLDLSTTPSVTKYYDETANSGSGGWTTTQITNVPFIVSNGSTTINGETVPAGVYIDTAYVADATIKQAQIGTLTADVITSGLLNTVDFYGNTIAGSTIYLGGTITYTTDSNGQNIGISAVDSPAATLDSNGVKFSVGAFTINNGASDPADNADYNPFEVVNNAVYIKTAMIQDLTATRIVSSDWNETNDTGGFRIDSTDGLIVNTGTFKGSISVNDKFTVDSSGNTTIKSATTGARLEITNSTIKVYDSSGVVRVQIGDLS